MIEIVYYNIYKMFLYSRSVPNTHELDLDVYKNRYASEKLQLNTKKCYLGWYWYTSESENHST